MSFVPKVNNNQRIRTKKKMQMSQPYLSENGLFKLDALVPELTARAPEITHLNNSISQWRNRWWGYRRDGPGQLALTASLIHACTQGTMGHGTNFGLSI